jgi:hypothetical protein
MFSNVDNQTELMSEKYVSLLLTVLKNKLEHLPMTSFNFYVSKLIENFKNTCLGKTF